MKISVDQISNDQDEQVFIWCYEITDEIQSIVINLMKVDPVRPALNGRLSAMLFNGEVIIISRQYVPALKGRLSGERV